MCQIRTRYYYNNLTSYKYEVKCCILYTLLSEKDKRVKLILIHRSSTHFCSTKIQATRKEVVVSITLDI